MGRLFGTDGCVGLANAPPSWPWIVGLRGPSSPKWVPGARPWSAVTPRERGEFLQATVTAGLASAASTSSTSGHSTPAVAYPTRCTRADLGVMLSASHNAMPDNGIKFFNADGNKLADHIEAQIKARLRETWDRPTGDAVGRIVRDDSADAEYG